MKRNIAISTIPVLVAGAFASQVFGQAQKKPNSKSRTAAVPRSITALPPSRESLAAERAAFAPSGQLYTQAKALLKAGDLAGAEQMARRSLAATPLWHGEKRPMLTVPLLLADILLREGKYQEALNYYLPAGQNTWRPGLNLDVALCYVRLGNNTKARQFYSDQAILEYNSQATVRDLPGTRTPQTLEASILAARGSDCLLSGRHEEAFADFDAALKLAPQNGFAAYHAGRSLLFLGRKDEAGPYFVKAMQNGHGEIAKEAERWASSYLRNQAEKQKAAAVSPVSAAQTPSKP